ncbi:EAL domain-containing protein [Acidimicrobiia bacterium EGI L10123]|uniref:bifunctional diguanylate cyclase/phosphodiesterase n=1 Tax=Salinilacustrithrix flava TaxID=2957203 RepID=UPI003D7C1C62|nr:EAL domain-containing protein [Acidimicrobiia bacterium EGI L10123]
MNRIAALDPPPWVQHAVMVGAYVALAAWGEAVSGAASVTLWYPAPGLAVAAVLLGGARFVVPTIVAELIVSIAIFDVAADFGVGLTVLNAVLVGGSYALVGLALRRARLDPTIPDVRSLGILAGGLLVGALPGAVFGTAILRWADVIASADQLDSLRTWLQGDAIGMLSVTPAIVLGITMRRADVIVAPRPPLRSGLGLLEIVSVVAVPVATALLIDRVDMLYLSLAPIVLVALRRAHPGSAIAAAIIAGLVPTTLAIGARGAFDRGDVVVLLAVIALTGIVMGVVVAEGFRSERTTQQLGHALGNTEDIVLIADAEGMPAWWNAAAERFILRDGDGLPCRVSDTLRGGAERSLELTRRVRSGQTWRGEEVLVDRDGVEVPVSLVVIPELGDEDHVVNYTLFARDASAERAYEAELTRHALYDQLTGVANRALLHARLQQATVRVRQDGMAAALLLFDLDRFKLVNDNLGHAFGDEVLRAVAERLSSVLRSTQTLARLGGDEFAVLAEDLQDTGGAARVAESVLEALRAPFQLGHGNTVVTASVGVVVLAADTDPDEVLRRADLAMYRAKARGGGRYTIYEQAMSAAAARRHRIESCLRSVIEEPTVPLHYQPVIEIDSGGVHFAEALLRLELADLGKIPPPEVLGVAHQIDRMAQLGRLIIDTAAQAAAAWPDPVGVSVNVSPIQLRDDELPDVLRRAADAAGLPVDRLIVELTEDAFLEEPEHAASVLRDCRQIGVRVALDDFGSGFSSLSILRTLPIDILKLDNALLSDLAESPQARAVVRAVTGVADALGLDVVAEGIETEAQLEICRSLGCRYGQGYFLGVPAPATEMAAHRPVG